MPRSLRRRHERRGLFEIFIALVLIRFVLLALLLVFLAPKEENSKKLNVEEKNALRIEIVWEASRNIDVDLWVKAPGERPVGWSNKGGKYLDLVRDDLGDTQGAHYEVVYGRSLVAGEYIVNVHLYANREVNYPIVPVEVRVYQVNLESKSPPAEIYNTKVNLLRVGDEATAVRFTVIGNSVDPTSFNTAYRKLYGTDTP